MGLSIFTAGKRETNLPADDVVEFLQKCVFFLQKGGSINQKSAKKSIIFGMPYAQSPELQFYAR